PTRLDSTQGGGSRSDGFTYDAANRLTAMCFQATSCREDDDQEHGRSRQRLTFTYDLVGNRLTRTAPGPGPDEEGHTERYHYDAADELLRITGDPGVPVSYRYDADGNQVEARTGGRDRSDVHFAYDLDNRLTSVDDGGQKTVYTQDAAGNRIAAVTTATR